MKFITIILTLLFCSALFADVLMIDRLQNNSGKDLPQKGMTMTQVESKYGSPVVKKDSIGNPPITKWEYDKFSVYFEHKHVIHAVIHQSTANEKGPKPIE